MIGGCSTSPKQGEVLCSCWTQILLSHRYILYIISTNKSKNTIYICIYIYVCIFPKWCSYKQYRILIESQLQAAPKTAIEKTVQLWKWHIVNRGVWSIAAAAFLPILLGWSPFPVIVTTRIITFLVGNPYKPSFPLLLGRGTTQDIA